MKKTIVFALIGFLLLCCVVGVVLSREKPQETWSRIPMVRYEDAVYLAATNLLPAPPTDWPVVGVVESTCGNGQIPTENNQTNHGKVGCKICVDPTANNYIAILSPDGSYALYQKNGGS